MEAAYEQAQKAYESGDVPVGAVLVYDGCMIAKAGNRVVRDHDPTAHAEILVLQQAGRLLKTDKLVGCDLYVTLEPCAMCAFAVTLARIRHVTFGALDPKRGAIQQDPRIFQQKTTHHVPTVSHGLMGDACSHILKKFFQEIRKEKKA